VNGAARTEASNTAQDGCASESALAQAMQQHLVQRFPTVLITLADEDAHQRALAHESLCHILPPYYRRRSARPAPISTASSVPVNLALMYRAARPNWPLPSNYTLS